MHNSNPLASWKLSSMHHYDNTVFLLASSFVMHYSPLRRSFKRGGCKMKAFTFRGLLLTGLHTLMWIHLDLSVFLNVFLRNECCCLQVKKCIFKSFGKSKTNFFFSFFKRAWKKAKGAFTSEPIRSFYKNKTFTTYSLHKNSFEYLNPTTWLYYHLNVSYTTRFWCTEIKKLRLYFRDVPLQLWKKSAYFSSYPMFSAFLYLVYQKYS